MRIFKIFKTYIFWAIVGIILMPIILKLDGVIQKDFNFSIVPFAIIGVYWFVFFVIASVKSDSRKKLIFAYISVLPLCLSIGEIFLYVKSGIDHTMPHNILGFYNKPNYSIKRTFKVDNEMIYNITYNTDENGLRVTTHTNKNYKKCINFYGCSFTFGSGVDDDKTLASQLAKALNSDDISVINYGIGGGGAHTMLARLESKMDSKIWNQCQENITLYIAIPHHIYRTFGVLAGPKYQLENKKAIYKGIFSIDEKNNLWKPIENTQTFTFTERINNQLQKSYIYKIFFFNTNPKSLLNSPIHRNGYFSNIDIFHLNTTSDLELYFAILKQTRDTLVNKYNSEFVVILWDYDMHAEFLDKYDEPIKKFLRQENIRFYTLSEIIPDYKQDFERIKNGDFEHLKYRLSRWDTHPNALANELIAKFLAEQIKNKDITFHSTNHISQSQQTP